MLCDAGNDALVRSGIAIIIPTFNEEKVIARTIRQFTPHRESFNLEIVVSDDSSMDGTREVAGPLADRLIDGRGAKRGRSAALNRGARSATKDLLVFLDADMIIDNLVGFFNEVYEIFNSRPEIAGGMMDFHVYPEERTIADGLAHAWWNAVMRAMLRMGWGVSTPGFQMGRRDVFDSMGGFDENLRLTQDVDYSLRLSRLKKLHYFRSAKLLESPRRYRDEGYLVYGYRSSLRWLSILLRHKSYGEYKSAR